MKLHTLNIFFLFILINGCSSVPLKNIHLKKPDNKEYSSAISKNAVSQPVKNILGNWQGIVSCANNNISFNLNINDAGNNQLKAKFIAQKSTLSFQKGVVNINNDMTGLYNPETAYFTLTDINGDARNKLTLKGILDPKTGMMIATASSPHYGKACSYLIAGQKNIKNIIDSINKISDYKAPGGRVNGGVQCETRTIDWLNSATKISNNTAPSRYDNKFMAFYLLQDESFIKYFGKPLNAMSSNDIHELQYQLQRQCLGKIHINQTKAILADVVSILQKNAGISIAELAIYPYARQAALNWRASAINQIENTPSSTTGNDYSQFLSSASDTLTILWPTGKNTLLTEVIKATNKKNAIAFSQKINKMLQTKPLTFETLVELARFATNQTIVKQGSGRYGIDASTYKNVNILIESTLNEQAVPLAKKYLQNLTSPKDIKNEMVALKSGPFRKLVDFLETDKVEKINRIFFDGGKTLSAAQIQNEIKNYSNNFASMKNSLHKLEKLTSYERSLNIKFGSVLDEPRMESFNRRRAIDRQKLIGNYLKTLIEQMENINSTDDLKVYYKKYALKINAAGVGAAGENFSRAYYNRRYNIDPFVDIDRFTDRAESDKRKYTAIYAGDYHAVDDIAEFKKMFLLFILNHKKLYATCMRNKSYSFKFSITTPTLIITDGYGVVTREPGYTNHYIREVPLRFKNIITHIYSNNGPLFVKSFKDPAYFYHMKSVMLRFGCHNPHIKKLEQGFIKIYNQLY